MKGYNGFGNDSHCVILLNGEEDAAGIGAPTFYEVSNGGTTHACTLYSADTSYPERDASIRKFGNNSWMFPSSSAQKGILVGNGLHEDWTIGSLDFTIDYWAYDNKGYISTGTQNVMIAGVYLDANNYWGIFYDVTGGTPASVDYHFISRRGGVNSIDLSFTLSITAGAFTHFAVVKKDSAVNIYVNGISQANGTLSSLDTINSNFKVGVFVDDESFDREFRIDEFRFSKGIARWTNNFTVPNRAY